MAEHIVPMGGLTINFGATGTAEVLQNVAMIITSCMYSCPMHRNFALDASVLDKPVNVAKALLRSRVLSAIQQYEPRAQVTKINFNGDINGVLQPTVKVMING